MKSRPFQASLLLSFFFFGFLFGQTDMSGPTTKEEILIKCADWQTVVAAYVPKPEIIDRLKGFPKEVRIEVFLGMWCPDSKTHVSEFFKVMEMADNPLFQTTFVALPKDKAQRAGYCRGRDIQKLPTFLVFIEGREVGRIIEVPETCIEEDLLKIIESFL